MEVPEPEAKRSMETIVTNNDLECFNAGCTLLAQEDFRGAFEKFLQGSRKNHPLSCHNLATLYEKVSA